MQGWLFQPLQMEEELHVSLGSGERGCNLSEDAESCFPRGCGNLLHGALPEPFVSHNSLAAHRLPAHFKLRLDHGQGSAARPQGCCYQGKDQGQRDEGNISDHEIDLHGQTSGIEMPRILSLKESNSWVLLELPGYLSPPDVNAIDMGSTSLQQAIGEATRGDSHVQDRHASHIQVEVLERPGELDAAP